MSWELALILAGFFAAAGIAFVLGACMAAGRYEDRLREIEADRDVRYAEHVPCPWTLKP